jgi:hypothetical protein
MKISELTTLATADSGDFFVVVDTSAGTTKKIDADNLPGASALANVVEDATPQLGGDLDLNGNGIALPGATVTDVTGADTTLVSGTAGTDGNLVAWDASGDAVDGPTPPTGAIVGTSDTQTLTDKTIAAADNTLSLTTDSVDAIAEIAAAIKTGADGQLVTGTAGTSGNLASWNADGDVIGAGFAATSVILAGGSVAFTADQSLGGFKVTNLGTPTAGTDGATKAYVDAASSGVSGHTSVRCATTATLTIGSATEIGEVIDGVTLADGDRVLIKNQATASENGIYQVQPSGAALRAADFDTALEARGRFVFVEEGAVNADSGWLCTNDEGDDVVGTDDLVFVQFSGAGQINAGAGLAKSGNELSVNVDDSTIEISGDSLRLKDDGIVYAKLATALTTGTDTTIVSGTAGSAGTVAVWDANGDAVSASTTGVDAAIVSGTAGTSGDLVVWDGNGDAVDGPTPPTGTIVGTSDTQTLTGKTIAAADNTVTIAAASVVSGTLLHERGGLEADVSAFAGLLKISGGATSQAVANTDYAAAAHAARHITGAADEVDGDKLDIDWNPSHYTPTTAPSEADSVDNLTAHLAGIDAILGTRKWSTSKFDTGERLPDGTVIWGKVFTGTMTDTTLTISHGESVSAAKFSRCPMSPAETGSSMLGRTPRR